jgi:hypothetical protein
MVRSRGSGILMLSGLRMKLRGESMKKVKSKVKINGKIMRSKMNIKMDN